MAMALLMVEPMVLLTDYQLQALAPVGILLAIFAVVLWLLSYL